MTRGTVLLLALGVCLLCGLLAGVLLLITNRRRREERARVEALLAGYRRPVIGATARVQLDRTQIAVGMAGRIRRLLRYDPQRRGQYPAGPWVVGGAALVLAAGLTEVAQIFVGRDVWIGLPLAALLLCRGCFVVFDQRITGRLYKQFPDVLAMIVRSVRVGLPVVEAVRNVAREALQPTAAEFAGLADQLAIGRPLDAALRDMAARHALPEYRFFAAALALQSQAGGSLTETLENLADIIRKRVAGRQKGQALAAEARMSAYILGALPIVTGGALSVINPGYMAVLFEDPSGRKLLLTGVGLLAMGAFSMHTLIRKSLS